MPRPLKFTKEMLYDACVNKGYTQKECADFLNVSSSTVFKYLKIWNIPHKTSKPIRISKNILINLYVNKKIGAEKTGEMLDCSSNIIKRELQRHKIHVRNISEARKIVESKIVIKINKNKLYDLYVIKQYTLKKCGEILKCSEDTIRRRLKKYGIKMRGFGDSRIKNKSILLNRIPDLYINKKYSMTKCGIILKCSREIIKKYLKRQDIPIRDDRFRSRGQKTKKKMRLSAIKRIENQNNDNQVCPAYSSDACNFFNYLNDKFDLKGHHAENGGEYRIKELGYWVDYYEPNFNLIIEWDEIHHYRNGQLRKKDIQRQKEIEDYLGCKFIRIKEDEPINLLEINGAIRRASLQHLF